MIEKLEAALAPKAEDQAELAMDRWLIQKARESVEEGKKAVARSRTAIVASQMLIARTSAATDNPLSAPTSHRTARARRGPG